MRSGAPTNRRSSSSIRPSTTASTASSKIGSHSPPATDHDANPWSRATIRRACRSDSDPARGERLIRARQRGASSQLPTRTSAARSRAACAALKASANADSCAPITGPASKPLRSHSARTAATAGAVYTAVSLITESLSPTPIT